jgi:hypothetical protein
MKVIIKETVITSTITNSAIMTMDVVAAGEFRVIKWELIPIIGICRDKLTNKMHGAIFSHCCRYNDWIIGLFI